MQRAFIVSDNASLDLLNKTLEEGEHYVEHVSASPNGAWLVILEEGEDDDFIDFEEELLEEQ